MLAAATFIIPVRNLLEAMMGAAGAGQVVLPYPFLLEPVRMTLSSVSVATPFIDTYVTAALCVHAVASWLGAEETHTLLRLLQFQALVQLCSYAPHAIIGNLLLAGPGRRRGVTVLPKRAAVSWHVMRYGLVYGSTLLLGLSGALLYLTDQPVSGIALLGSGAAVGTTFLSLVIALRNDRKHGRKPRDRWVGAGAALLAGITLAGVFVGIAGPSGMGGLFNVPILMGACGALMLAVLGLMPKIVLRHEAGGSPHALPTPVKLLLTQKIVTISASAVTATASVGLFFTFWMVGPPLLPPNFGWLALGLAIFAMLAQLCVQFGNGFGEPMYVNPLLTWSVLSSFAIEGWRGQVSDWSSPLICFVLVAFGTSGLTWLSQRDEPGSLPEASPQRD